MLETSWAELKKNKFTQMKTALQHPPIEVAGDLFCEAQEMFYGLWNMTDFPWANFHFWWTVKSKCNMIIMILK